MNPLPDSRRSEHDSIALDARQVIDLTPEERADIFMGLDGTLAALLAHLPPQERHCRREAARLLDPLPTPCWKNLHPSARPHDDAAP